MKIHCFLIMVLVLFASSLLAQSVVQVGMGSYASEPPAGTMSGDLDLNEYATNATIYTMPGETRPIPTNDWWTDVIANQYGGGLWAYPYFGETHSTGMSFFFPQGWNSTGTDMEKGTSLVIKGDNFTPSSALVKDWSDWNVQIHMADDDNSMDFTLAHGIPYVWVEADGITPQFDAVGAVFADVNGDEITFPYTGSSVFFLMDKKYYGVFTSAGTVFEKSGNQITLQLPTDKKFFSLGFIPNENSFELFEQHALVIPRSTEVSWNYQPEIARVTTTWTIDTENLDGKSEAELIQGFIPHHYKRVLSAPAFDGPDFISPRGLMKSSIGNSFAFSYKMSGILPHYPEPVSNSNDVSPYSADDMDGILDTYAGTMVAKTMEDRYADDTYWGGKDIIVLAKNALISNTVDNAYKDDYKETTKSALVNWLTYTPGETKNYFAYYPKWKGLVGLNPSYGSDQFNDHHFHYGYLVHAGALYGMLDNDFLDDYGDMLTMIVKDYANWDRSDNNFPFMRTMDPWMGHSYAGGMSSGGGNNQESTSEAMQSWIGMFLLGEALGNDEMRNAAAFGYNSEARATLEYWFDWDKENLSDNYEFTTVGILWNGGCINGVYWGSSDNPHWIHGIQYLPASIGMQYLAWDTAWAKGEYDVLMDEALSLQGWTDENSFGDDWANVVLGFRMLWDPEYVTAKYKTWLEESNSAASEAQSAHIYYYAHYLQNQGSINWEYELSIPTSQVFYNSENGDYTFLAYNYSSVAVTCNILKDGVYAGEFEVAANSFASFTTSDTLTSTIKPIYNTIPKMMRDAVNAKGQLLNDKINWISRY